MQFQKKLPNTLIVLIYLASAAVLIMSPVCAADSAPSATDGQGTAFHGTGHHEAFNATMQAEHLQSMITKLGQQGVDITQVQADLTAGNSEAVKTWFQTYFQSHPMTFANRTGSKPPVNTTQQAERFQTMITKLGQQGVDINQVQADLTAGNTEAVKTWFGTYLQNHPMTFANRTGSKPPVNTTQQAERFQTMITKLGQQGVDITQVQADLTAGNTDAVKAWFQTYRKDHPDATLKAFGNQSRTVTSGTIPHTFPGHRVMAGNSTAMNWTAAHHTRGSGTAS